jgi:hypothetical protein
MNPKRLSIWSGPRNISTALMYSFAQRPDTRVVDEPFYGAFLKHGHARDYHPVADEIMASMECDPARVVSEVILGDYDRPVVFFKSMTHHLSVCPDLHFLKKLDNVLLTRDPVDMLPSLKAIIGHPSLEDTGYPELIKVCEEIEKLNRRPIVIDSRRLLRDPEHYLQSLCKQLELPFEASMLSWPAGPRPEDGIWAPHWYTSTHQSTGFAPYQPKAGPFPDELRPLLKECQPCYERLLEYAIE